MQKMIKGDEILEHIIEEMLYWVDETDEEVGRFLPGLGSTEIN